MPKVEPTDTERLDWLVENEAEFEKDPKGGCVVFVRKIDSWGRPYPHAVGGHETDTRTAIDTAMAAESEPEETP